jgi:uncharacterized membrane protein
VESTPQVIAVRRLPGAPLRIGTALPAAVPVVLAAGVVALQIAYPLASTALRHHLTVAIVVVFAAMCVAHAAVTRGPARAAAVFAVTAVPGYLVEAIGVGTGVPFGAYRYSDVLGPRMLGVPLVIGLAWTMLSWPAALVARRLVLGRVTRVLVGAWATTVGDLFLDPQMVASGAWTWRDTVPHLPGVPGVPLTNYAGWLLVTLALSALVQAVMGAGPDALGVGMYLWFWAAWTVALGLFLGLSAAACWGAVAMGTVAVPVGVRWLRSAPGRPLAQRPQ